MSKPFVLKAEHVALLKAAYWRWDNCETGAPQIDPKRPYGNSSVALDVAEILGWTVDPNGLMRAQEEKAMQLHYETLEAVQAIIEQFKFSAEGELEALGQTNLLEAHGG